MFIDLIITIVLARFGRADNQFAMFQLKLMSARPNREEWVWRRWL
jgi:hypothetical protein